MERIWASGGMVYTLVLEASAERIESSSLSLPTKLWKCDRVRFIVAVLKTAVSKGTVSSNLTVSAKC